MAFLPLPSTKTAHLVDGNPSLLDQVQLYQLDLVQRVWSTGLSVAEVLDLVQHRELDLVQAGFDGREHDPPKKTAPSRVRFRGQPSL